jgi:hypothetical protein
MSLNAARMNAGSASQRENRGQMFWLKSFVLAAIIGWGALFLSSSAILVGSEIVPSQQAGGQSSLTCSYFTGTGLIERMFWYSKDGVMGKAACPRLVQL